jgi:hypothetical protein
MGRYRHSSPRSTGIAGALFGLLLVFTFPIWMPVWISFSEFLGTIISALIQESLS